MDRPRSLEMDIKIRIALSYVTFHDCLFKLSGLIQKHFEFLWLKVSFAPNKRRQAAKERNHHVVFVIFLTQMAIKLFYYIPEN